MRHAMILVGMLLLSGQMALGAQISVDQNYVSRLVDLRRLYPAQSADSVVAPKIERADYFGTNGVFNPFSPEVPSPKIIRIVGPLERGDAGKLKQTIDGIEQYGPLFVSFDSPGGVFVEAFEIASVIVDILESQDPRIAGVIVFAGDECLSACAVTFAASFDRAHPGVDDNRFVERGARLGFHMPYLPDQVEVSAGDGRAMLDLGYDISDFMVGLLDTNANPPELLRQMLKHREPDKFFELHGDLETWRLGFSPVASLEIASTISVSGLDTSTAGMLCNLALVGSRAHMSFAEDEFCDFRLGGANHEDIPNPDNLFLTQLGAAQGPVALNASCIAFSCQLRTNKDYEVGVAVWRGSDGCPSKDSDSFPSRMCRAPVEVGVHNVTNHFLAEALSCRDGAVLDGAFVQRSPITKHDVNMRTSPALDAAFVKELKAGTPVSIVGCRITTDSQGVWYEVTQSGQRGWVSARFVGGHDERFQYRGNRFGN